MVLANNGGVVSSGLEGFWESPLFLVEDSAIVILHESIDVTVFGCDDNCSGGTTQRVSNQGVVEAHALVGKPVDVRCVDMGSTIGTDSLHGVVVGHHEEDVWSLIGAVLRTPTPSQSKGTCKGSQFLQHI